jgi:hypothetical protein
MDFTKSVMSSLVTHVVLNMYVFSSAMNFIKYFFTAGRSLSSSFTPYGASNPWHCSSWHMLDSEV